MELDAERDTGLTVAKGSRFTILLSSGDIGLLGKVFDSDPNAFHVFHNTSAGLIKQGTIPALCKHK